LPALARRELSARRGARAARAVAAALLLGLALLACAELVGPPPLPPDPRMLRALIGPGTERMKDELIRNRAVLAAIEGHGWPDYVWAPAPDELVLLYLAGDEALHFAGDSGQRRLVETRAPISDEWLDLTAPDDRDEVRARRTDLRARALAARPGWCRSADEPVLGGSCRRDPEAARLLVEIRRKVMAAWRSPAPEHGGERVIVRFRIAPSGALAERCAIGATSPTAAATALAAFDAAFPIEPLAGGAACLAEAPVLVRLEVATD
jgi:hypothetical protein